MIAYINKNYNTSQLNYPAIELEFFGLIFAIKHWQSYLIGKPFIVETDSKSVQWIKGKRDCLDKLGRWSSFLENFDFWTKHVPGKDYLGPDALSRISENDTTLHDLKSIDNVPTKLWNVKQWSNEIESDPQLVKLVEKNNIVRKDSVFVRADNKNNIIVVPKSPCNDISGIRKTLSRVKERYFWPGLAKFVKHNCASCHFCAVNKDNKAPNNAPLLAIMANSPNGRKPLLSNLLIQIMFRTA